MERITLLSICFLLFLNTFCQDWTPQQLDAANTAKEVKGITDVEKAAIQYINLARLFPQLFITNELENYVGTARYGDYLRNSPYKKSLIKELRNRKPIGALQFDASLYELAKCFAKETGDAGTVTHKRKKCPDGYLAECVSFGMDAGKDIAMQWLIDDKSPGLGHRINCLNNEYTMVAISVHKHKVYTYCAVADFR